MPQCAFEDTQNGIFCPIAQNEDTSEPETCYVCTAAYGGAKNGDLSPKVLQERYNFDPAQAARAIHWHLKTRLDPSPNLTQDFFDWLENLSNDQFRQIVFDRVNRELNPSSKDQK